MEFQTVTDEKKPSNKETSLLAKHPKVSFILVALLALYSLSITTLFVSKLDSKSTSNTSLTGAVSTDSDDQSIQPQNNQASNAEQTFSMLRIYPSLDRHFSFYIYPNSVGSSECKYGIRYKEGIGPDVSRALGLEKLTCSERQGNLSSSFAGWADGSKFLINENNGEIKIFDVDDFKAESYTYDTSKYVFVGASRSLNYWLFKKTGQNTTSYILLDRNNNIALDNINFESNDRGVLYDEVNDGFLFISRTFTGEKVSVKFDFLSVNNLNLRNILTTEPVEAPGRGCYSEYLLSKPGEIILTPGCLTVGEKYIGFDGNIHINLQV